MKKKILEYSITFFICALLSFILLVVKGVFENPETKALMHYFVDSFFVSGILCLAFGLLVLASNGGAFDLIIYGVTRFFSLFKRDPTKVKYKTYYDYHIARAERKKTEFLFLIIVGSIYVIASMVFLCFWYQY